jgi:F-type H+-transporting ATPase subunit a
VGSHFTWFDTLGVSHHYTNVAVAMTATVLIILLSVAGRLALGSGEAAIEPAGHMSLKGFFEAFTEFITSITHQVLGHHSDYLIPMFGSMFFYIIFNNLLGLVPGMTAATSDINAAFAIGLFSFVGYNAIGVHHAGLAYFKHYLGPIWWMIPILLPIEIISNFIRPLSLGIRLHVNMMADHTILGTFLDLTKVIIPVIFYGMGTFVSFVQAFVFMMLSMVYVLMATADDH